MPGTSHSQPSCTNNLSEIEYCTLLEFSGIAAISLNISDNEDGLDDVVTLQVTILFLFFL